MATTKVVRDSIVVFGSSGFIGGRICAEARRRGLNVIGLSRSATPLPYFAVHDGAPQPAGAITLAKADALDPATYAEHLARAQSVVIAIGSPPLPDRFIEGGGEASVMSNGNAVIKPLRAAKDAKVPNVVVINAAMPAWLSKVSTGYATGKTMADAAAQKYAVDGVMSVACLKPGVVFGTRHVGEAQVPLPLGVVFVPLRMFMRIPIIESGMAWLRTTVPFVFENLLVQPVGVDELAKTAVSLSTEEGTGYTEVYGDEIIKKSHAESLSTFMDKNS